MKDAKEIAERKHTRAVRIRREKTEDMERGKGKKKKRWGGRKQQELRATVKKTGKKSKGKTRKKQ